MKFFKIPSRPPLRSYIGEASKGGVQVLDIAELMKDRTPMRYDVLADKLESDDPAATVKIAGGGEVKLVNIKVMIPSEDGNPVETPLADVLRMGDSDLFDMVFINKNRYMPVLRDQAGHLYALNQIEKTGDFGGKGGIGGNENTEVQEVGQALALGIYVNNGNKIALLDLTPEALQQAVSHVEPRPSPAMIQSVLELINADKQQTWGHTFVAAANALGATYTLPGMKFHRGSKWVNGLYEMFRRLAKEDKNSPFGITRINANPWNPSDIWLVGEVSLPSAKDCPNLDALNSWIAQQLLAEKLIGVSLKKIAVGKTATVKPYNADPIRAVIGATVKRMLVSNDNSLQNLFKNQNGKVEFDLTATESLSLLSLFKTLHEAEKISGENTYRTGGNADIKGEINSLGDKGTNQARHGSIGFGPLLRVVQDVFKFKIPSGTDIRAMIKADRKAVIAEIFDMAVTITQGKGISLEDRKELFTKSNALETGGDRSDLDLISKYQSLFVLQALSTSGDAKKSEYMSRFLELAGAQHPKSSAYVKVS